MMSRLLVSILNVLLLSWSTFSQSNPGSCFCCKGPEKYDCEVQTAWGNMERSCFTDSECESYSATQDAKQHIAGTCTCSLVTNFSRMIPVPGEDPYCVQIETYDFALNPTQPAPMLTGWQQRRCNQRGYTVDDGPRYWHFAQESHTATAFVELRR
eukprot:TRINITY_DN66734_c0_g1_i1.p1 TRINITY_DN66734_c0_g1~~TRINITY_DN66734_c0_g1_i1.p1  ORF type:complete len:155 (-),score=10.16 TRINITY_DN66734_c0_g1_i1:122-586(-)